MAGNNSNTQVATQKQGGKSTQVTEKQWLQMLESGLMQELADHGAALPVGFKKERFVLNAVAVVKDHIKDFKNIDFTSIKLCLAKGAYLGLDFLNGECYAIPYSGIANFQTDYKGEIKLAKKYSRNKIKDIYAKNVRQGDDFVEEIIDGRQTVNFRPKPFSNEPIIGTFGVVLYEDGSMIYDTMSVEEIEHTRDTYSKAKNSQAWKESKGEMYKKTVLRRLLKLVDLDFDNMEQIRAFDDGSDFEFNSQIERRTQATPENMAGVDVVADAFATEAEPQAQAQPDEGSTTPAEAFGEQQTLDGMAEEINPDELPFA